MEKREEMGGEGSKASGWRGEKRRVAKRRERELGGERSEGVGGEGREEAEYRQWHRGRG